LIRLTAPSRKRGCSSTTRIWICATCLPPTTMPLACPLACAFEILTMGKGDWMICYQHPCQISQFTDEVEMVTAFVLEQEALTKRFFYQNRYLRLRRLGTYGFIPRPGWLIF